MIQVREYGITTAAMLYPVMRTDNGHGFLSSGFSAVVVFLGCGCHCRFASTQRRDTTLTGDCEVVDVDDAVVLEENQRFLPIRNAVEDDMGCCYYGNQALLQHIIKSI
jgi:hypothetical protein